MFVKSPPIFLFSTVDLLYGVLMIIQKITREDKKALALKVDSGIYSDLELFQDYYYATFDDKVTLNEVAENLLSVIIAKDKKFQTFKKSKQ
jgi:hypothetical protein